MRSKCNIPLQKSQVVSRAKFYSWQRTWWILSCWQVLQAPCLAFHSCMNEYQRTSLLGLKRFWKRNKMRKLLWSIITDPCDCGAFLRGCWRVTHIHWCDPEGLTFIGVTRKDSHSLVWPGRINTESFKEADDIVGCQMFNLIIN